MIKKLSILVVLCGIIMFSGAGVVLACAGPAADCATYCADPCDPVNNPGGWNEPNNAYCVCSPIHSTTLEELLESVINYIFWFATAITPIMVVFAGFLFLTSGGSMEKVAQAKRIMIYTVVGYGIVLFSRGLISILAEIMGA